MNNMDAISSFSYGDVVEEKDDIDEVSCPFCGHETCVILRDYVGMHEKEVLLHCCNEDCGNLHIRVYKFSHVIKLNKEESQEKDNLEKF